MRSGMIGLVACAAILALAACSADDSKDAMIAGLPNEPGAGGSSSASTTPAAPAALAGAGGGASEMMSTPVRAPSDNVMMMLGSNALDAGAADAGDTEQTPTDAGVTPPRADAAVNPPPAVAPVGFSDVFQLLLDNCGNCHGANAPANRPRFAQAGNQAASFTAAQATSPNGGLVSGRIIARAVTTRDMPPACGRAALGTGACLDAAEAALLQAWVAQGAQP